MKLRNLLINLGLLIAAILVLVFFLNILLNWYTHKGESLTVPDLRGRTIEEAKGIIAQRDLDLAISDTIYDATQPRLSILEQNQKPVSKVKRGRKIYLTVNAPLPPKVSIPDEVLSGDVQYAQAVKMLESYGFKVGQVKRVPGIAENVVKEVHYKDQVVKPGMKLDKGSVVDLYLEDGGKGEKFPMRSLIGMPYDEAYILIKGDNLNPGNVIPENPETKDFKGTFVYKQNPVPGSNISQGEAVDLWVTDSTTYFGKYAH
jgi:beta-lactam-binding protein with PASTA domain